jgi:hypothetical protein
MDFKGSTNTKLEVIYPEVVEEFTEDIQQDILEKMHLI